MRSCRVEVSATLLLLLASGHAQSKPASQGADPFSGSRAARDGGRYAMLLRQMRAEEPGLPARHVAGPRPAMASYQGEKDIPAGHWVWVRPFWYVFRDGPDTTQVMRSWGPEQACGAPNTPQAGDCSSAWATRDMDRADEWLLLELEEPILGTALEVHESYHPGAVAAVSVFLADGEERELWRAERVGAIAEASRVLKIDLPLGFRFERIRLHMASEAVPSWNEIDAVGVRDAKGKVHWAARAEASSTYAEVNAAAVAPMAPLPLPVFVPVPADPTEARIAALEARIAALEAEIARLRRALEKKK